jgi:hypothetical protein
MMVGDINGAVVGALLLRWLAKHTQLVHIVRQRVIQAPTHNNDDARQSPR